MSSAAIWKWILEAAEQSIDLRSGNGISRKAHGLSQAASVRESWCLIFLWQIDLRSPWQKSLCCDFKIKINVNNAIRHNQFSPLIALLTRPPVTLWYLHVHV